MATLDYAALLTEGLRKAFDEVGGIQPPMGKRLFHVEPSSSRSEQIQHFVPYGLPQERIEGEPLHQGAVYTDFGVQVAHRNFSLADLIPDEAIADDMYGLFTRWCGSRGSLMAESYRVLYETEPADYYANIGFATGTVNVSPDGVALFSNSHPLSAVDTNTTWSNLLSGDPALSMSSLQEARAMLGQQEKANGRTLLDNPIKFLVVNGNLEEMALQLSRGDWVPGTADRNMNTMRGRFEPFIWNYWRHSGSTNANAYNSWFVQGRTHYMYWFVREEVNFASQKILNIRSTLFASYCRFSLVHSSARGHVGSLGP